MELITKHLVERQIPAHIRAENPLFTKFVEYYYEFLDDQKITKITQDVTKFNDVDSVDIQFVRDFYEEFRSLPKNLATDERFVAKYIYDLYKTKGSEASLKLLFKIVYGDDIRVRYPHQYILRASDGRWSQEKFIDVSFASGIGNFDYTSTGLLEFTNDFGQFSIPVTRFDYLSSTKLRVYFKSYFSFTITPSQAITVKDNTGNNAKTGVLVETITKIKLVSTGPGWVKGQVIVVPGTTKDSIIRVTDTDILGNIRKIETIEYGYSHNPLIVYTFSDPDVAIGFDTGWVGTTRGFYENDIGQISNPEIRLQDSKYYQQYSYVISTDVGIETFRDVIKLVHPAGTKYFSELTRVANFSIREFIDSYYTFSVDTIYAQDIVILTDSYAINVSKNVEETISTSDTSAKSVTITKTDTATTSDAAAKSVNKQATGETVTVTDSYSLHATIPVFDQVDNITDIETKAVTKGLTDTASIADAIASIVSSVVKSDTYSASDSATREVNKLASDSVTLNDTAAKIISNTLLDSAISSDAISLSPSKTLASSASYSDELTSRAFTKAISDSISSLDQITQFAISLVLADTTNISDATLIQGNISIALADTVTVTDTLNRTVTFSRSATDTVTISDSYGLVVNKYSSDSVAITDGTPVTTSITYNSQDYFAELYVSSETIIDIS